MQVRHRLRSRATVTGPVIAPCQRAVQIAQSFPGAAAADLCQCLVE